jgi:hypothetical protein
MLLFVFTNNYARIQALEVQNQDRVCVHPVVENLVHFSSSE